MSRSPLLQLLISRLARAVRRPVLRASRREAPLTACAAIERLEDRTLLSAALALPNNMAASELWHENQFGTPPSTPGPAPFALEDTFLLHSNPGANFTIYLDFTGHVTSGTQWNVDFNNGQDFVSPVYDPDGNGDEFTENELTIIQRVWQSVAEDFIPFNVNVTTEEPPADWLIKSGPNDTRWGIRVVITEDQSVFEQEIGGLVGGLAYLGSFAWDTDTPAFVFNMSEIGVREAVSHEVGHALGLRHDGQGNQEYYLGHGTGPTSWAPIMGAAYYVNVSQWSKGEYAGATNLEDDLAIITNPALNGGGWGYSGLSYRADDHGNTTATASQLTIEGNSVVNDSGIIERNTDIDMFSFFTTGGLISVNIDPYEYAPNLDIRADLLDATGNVILTSNPNGNLSAQLSTTLTAGLYYISVQGDGDNSPGGGYTDYGSLGRYTITGTIPSSDQNQPASVTLVNKVVTLPEDTSTASRVKVADILVIDDGRGTNVLSLSGPDAALFEIVGLELYLRAGTPLSADLRPVLSVTVNVDDPTIPGFPDDSDTLLLSITRVTKPPVITGFTQPVTYNVGGPMILLDTAVSLSAPGLNNFSGGMLWVTLPDTAQPGDRLDIRDQGNWPGQIGVNGQNITYGGVVIGTRSSSALVVTFNANATVQAVQALLRNLVFHNTQQLPSTAPRTVRVQLTDGIHPQRVTVSKTINVSTPNLPPVISNFAGAVDYHVGAGPTLVGAGLIVSDPDSPNFDGGQLWVTIPAGSQPGDQLGVRNQGTAAGQIGVSGPNVTYGGTVIGTRTGAGLVIVFNANATVAAVQALLRNLTYYNNSSNPVTGTRTLRIQLTDGDSPIRATVNRSIHVAVPNAPPVIANLGSTANYQKGGPPILIDSTVTVTDADSPNFGGGQLWVTLPNGAQPGDRLGIRHEGHAPGQIGVNGLLITYGGVVIGSRSPSALVVTFNENATAAAVQALLRNLTYHNTLADPVTSHFPLRIQLTDGDSPIRTTVTKFIRIV